MPILVIPLVIVAFAACCLLLYPFALFQRYRLGKARRRGVRWLITFNGVLLVLSVLLFLSSAWVASHWNPHALSWAASGLLVGGLLGFAGIATTRFERGEKGTWYTPNRWLVLALTLFVVARLLTGLWQFARQWQAPVADGSLAWELLADHASLFAAGGLLLGYYTLYTWLLRPRLAARVE